MQADIDFKSSDDVLNLNNPFLVNELDLSQQPSDFLNADGSLKGYSELYNDYCIKLSEMEIAYSKLGEKVFLTMLGVVLFGLISALIYEIVNILFNSPEFYSFLFLHTLTLSFFLAIIGYSSILYFHLITPILKGKLKKAYYKSDFRNFEKMLFELIDCGHFKNELNDWLKEEKKSSVFERWSKKKIEMGIGLQPLVVKESKV